MIGGHVAALPERTLREESCDFVAHDEGLQTIVDLLEADRAGDTDYSKVRGLAYWTGGTLRQFRSNAAAPLVKDLDVNMPGIAWDLLPMQRYRAHNWHCFGDLEREPYAAIYTTLGCPYSARSAASRRRSKRAKRSSGSKRRVNSYRFWSPERVIEEIDLLVKQIRRPQHQVRRRDVRAERAPRLGICDLIIERGYDLNIWAYARVDTVKDGMLDKLRRAGVQLARVRHRGGQRSRAQPTSTSATRSSRSTTPSRRSRRPASTSSATTSSACPRTISTACSRRWTWRSS